MAARVLVADDDAWILRMVSSILQKRGYEVDTASDGQEAYDKALANIPDLLITDVMMPKMDGWSLVRALRARPEFNFVPVIFLTALTSDDDRIRGFRLGADDYLPKPFRFEELDLRVSKTVRRRESLERETRAQIEAPSEPEQNLSSSTALIGDLEQIGLSILLTLLEMEKKSGILKVSAPGAGGHAEIWLDDGRVVSAEMQRDGSPVRDEECIYHLLEWNRGRFEFMLVKVSVEARMSASATQLLMEGAKRIDELAESQRRESQSGEAAKDVGEGVVATGAPAAADASQDEKKAATKKATTKKAATKKAATKKAATKKAASPTDPASPEELAAALAEASDVLANAFEDALEAPSGVVVPDVGGSVAKDADDVDDFYESFQESVEVDP